MIVWTTLWVTMTATMIVSLRSLFSLALDLIDPDCLVFNLKRSFQFYGFNEQIDRSFLMVLIIFK